MPSTADPRSRPPAASTHAAAPEILLRVRGLSVGYGGPPVIDGIDLDVRAGQFTSLIGPSGSGKTSILRVVTGLVEPMRGTVELGVALHDVGFLFQDDALLPWRTARQNVALGLRIRDLPPAEADTRADHWLSRLGLAGYGDRFPGQLSGGQRKRVAIAQVLALRPKLLLMDEPFAALDAIVRTRITQELLNWVEREHLTVLLVTHDLEEAISASDTVAVLGHGPRAAMRARHAVDIPRPRDVLEARRHPAFGPLLRTLWDDLTAETASSPATADEAGR
jgi:NitT/TauT family transport system ATP-binding protein